MATPAVPNANLGAINRILAEIGRSIGDETDAGGRISDGEASKIVGHLGSLPAAERAEVQTALRELLVADFFTVTPEARKRLAQAFGLEARELEPRERAELIGLASARTAFQAGVQAIAKTPQMDRKTMKKLVEGAETYLDRPGQAFLAAVLRNASRDGTLKLDTEARKQFSRWVGGLEHRGLVSDWSKGLDLPGSGRTSYLSQLVASGMCFEDIVAAFMLHMVGKIRDETQAKMEEIERLDRDEKKQVEKRSSKLDDLFKSRGLDQPGGENTAPAPGAPEAPKPDPAPALSEAYVKQTKRHLESVVQSVHAHMAETDDTPGIIDAQEAARIAEKFARLEGPVATLIAKAMVNSLRSTPGVYLEGDTFRPIVDWAKSKLGDDIDLSPLPRRNPGDPTDPVAKQLRSSDKLEDKIASFIVDTLLCSDQALGDKMRDLKQLTSDMLDNPRSQQALAAVVQPGPDGPPATPAAAGDARRASAAEATAATMSAPEAAAPEAPALDATALTATPEATAAAAPTRSRQMLWEELKQLQNELSQVMQALSNILNSMHQNAMNSVRAIR